MSLVENLTLNFESWNLASFPSPFVSKKFIYAITFASSLNFTAAAPSASTTALPLFKTIPVVFAASLAQPRAVNALSRPSFYFQPPAAFLTSSSFAISFDAALVVSVAPVRASST
jgi:hypothetical protein